MKTFVRFAQLFILCTVVLTNVTAILFAINEFVPQIGKYIFLELILAIALPCFVLAIIFYLIIYKKINRDSKFFKFVFFVNLVVCFLYSVFFVIYTHNMDRNSFEFQTFLIIVFMSIGLLGMMLSCKLRKTGDYNGAN